MNADQSPDAAACRADMLTSYCPIAVVCFIISGAEFFKTIHYERGSCNGPVMAV